MIGNQDSEIDNSDTPTSERGGRHGSIFNPFIILILHTREADFVISIGVENTQSESMISHQKFGEGAIIPLEATSNQSEAVSTSTAGSSKLNQKRFNVAVRSANVYKQMDTSGKGKQSDTAAEQESYRTVGGP